MEKELRRFLLSSLILAAVIIFLSLPISSLPPLGPFFNPWQGFWQNAAPTEKEPSLTLKIPGLRESVTIVYDERSVPHIFAKNDHDLYLAQGYVTAKDRLWQMDMQIRSADGRLAEVAGKRALNHDRYKRHLGLSYGADQAVKAMKKDSTVWQAVQAYADGVNAYINSLSDENYPLEYKLMQFSPEQWTPEKSALLLKNMTYTLAGRSNDYATTNTLKYMGEEYLEEVIGPIPKWTNPIIPKQKSWKQLPAPDVIKPDSPYVPGRTSAAAQGPSFEPDPANGSNNWAVSGAKTRSGYPLLANDPHLGTTLPSIWYEVQLHAPGNNVYGVSLPGAPMVIIGFNEQSAWGFTNTGSDVMDWYALDLRKSGQNVEYRYDGAWRQAKPRIERIEVKGGETVTDTVYYTHHGPIVSLSGGSGYESSSIPKDHSLRWIAHDPSNEMRFFYDINRAGNIDDLKKALPHFIAPSQNIAFADTHGNIAMWISGKLPMKWQNQGLFIGDGSDPAYDWQGWIPKMHNPHQVNPDRGFVSSANQEVAAEEYPYYLDDRFGDYERGKRINDRLSKMENATVDSMRKLQLDVFSLHAESILPEMLSWLPADSLNDSQHQGIERLSTWNFQKTAEKVAPTLFRRWWFRFYEAIWDDEMPADSLNLPFRSPSRDQTVALLKKSTEQEWIDNQETDKRETISDLALQSYRKAFGELVNDHGPISEKWKYGRIRPARIPHLARIPGMGRTFKTGGDRETINAINDDHAPSWRMVVDLKPPVAGYGVYPGGASGNPGSIEYDRYTRDWADGNLYRLNFWNHPNQAENTNHIVTLE